MGGNATDRTDWPLHRGIKDLAPQGFASGDFPRHQHAVLWAKENVLKHMGGIPEPAQKAPLVIVGGGMAGLTMAYLLRDQKPFVLEQDLHFGGIFFVEQDNWMLPALETVIGEALHWTPHVRNVLGCGLLSKDLSYKRNKNN